MTVIVAYHAGNKIALGVDSQASIGTAKYKFCNDKIIEACGWALGLAGYVRHSSIIQEEPEKVLTYSHPVVVATAIRDLIEEDQGEMGAGDNVKGVDFEAMLVDTQRLRLYLIDGSFGVQEIVPFSFWAAGGGASQAIGAMASLIAYCADESPERLVRLATEAAIETATGCGGEAIVKVYTK